MDELRKLADAHARVTRRYFMEAGASAAALAPWAAFRATAQEIPPMLQEAVSKMAYLTKDADFKGIGRGEPPPHTLPPERLREVGLHPDTWQLEVLPDSESDAKLEHPLSNELGTALNWAGLMKIAESFAVRYLCAMSCTNVADPFGMGLWEGVPLREIIWRAKPLENVRRVFYYGYHNNLPEQRFQASLPLGRVLEDPPGEHPVIVCYKLNDQWLSPERGGPVRMLVPDAYGNKSVKWLQRIVLTNTPQANDTYALWNNDTESARKTHARFVNVPEKAKAGQPVPITGIALVGAAGLSRVQYCLSPVSASPSENDPHFSSEDWRDAVILPPPVDWGGDLPKGRLPETPLQFEPQTREPRQWPLRNTLAHWAALLENIPPGRYHVRCRTIDEQGAAQPMPRPYKKSGNNAIHTLEMEIEA